MALEILRNISCVSNMRPIGCAQIYVALPKYAIGVVLKFATDFSIAIAPKKAYARTPQ